MSTSSVCAICITADRPEMTMRAVKSFTDQTYPKKRLLVYDTSAACPEVYPTFDAANVLYFHAGPRNLTIGALRNEAIEFAQMAVCPGQFDIVAHFDSDDISHSERLSEQVALLQSSGADVVGFNEMLFWREPVPCMRHGLNNSIQTRANGAPGEAWLYSNPNQHYALGTSLCMWRSAWERKPFEATSQGEDERWLRGMKSVGVSSIGPDGAPRLVARIHEGNTSTAYSQAKMNSAKEWQRVQGRDEELRRLMEVA